MIETCSTGVKNRYGACGDVASGTSTIANPQIRLRCFVKTYPERRFSSQQKVCSLSTLVRPITCFRLVFHYLIIPTH
ncbi:hypothetical protein M758_UG071000 [Ceratodon purpureus]|nr:hypothetical protein M758_UG071000 [Ceratodon purpureus]